MATQHSHQRVLAVLLGGVGVRVRVRFRAGVQCKDHTTFTPASSKALRRAGGGEGRGRAPFGGAVVTDLWEWGRGMSSDSLILTYDAWVEAPPSAVKGGKHRAREGLPVCLSLAVRFQRQCHDYAHLSGFSRTGTSGPGSCLPSIPPSFLPHTQHVLYFAPRGVVRTDVAAKQKKITNPTGMHHIFSQEAL